LRRFWLCQPAIKMLVAKKPAWHLPSETYLADIKRQYSSFGTLFQRMRDP
jgi:hypothetical protein